MTSNLKRRHLLTGAAAGIATATLGVPQSAEAGRISFGRFKNWAGNIAVRPRWIQAPRNLSELVAIARRHPKIKLLGSGHSFSACAATTETLVRTEGLNRLLAFDSDAGLVKAEAGMKLKDFNEIVAKRGFCLPSIGDIAEQSLAGLVSTGTHGTGMAWGSLSDQETLKAMTCVGGHGQIRRFGPQDEGSVAWQAHRLGLGGLGMIYDVTLKVVPVYYLEMHARVANTAEALAGKPWLSNDHYEFFVFPFSDKCQTITRNRTTKGPYNRIRRWATNRFVENALVDVILTTGAHKPAKIPQIMAFFVANLGEEHVIDRADRIMASKRSVRFWEMEYALPVAKIGEALAFYHAQNAKFANRRPQPFYASFPGEVRFLRGDRGNLLTPSAGQDVAFFAVQCHHAYTAGAHEYFQEMEVGLRQLGGRPHWGKMFYQNPKDLYPGFADFAKVRATVDPDRQFSNPFVDRLIAGAPLKPYR